MQVKTVRDVIVTRCSRAVSFCFHSKYPSFPFHRLTWKWTSCDYLLVLLSMPALAAVCGRFLAGTAGSNPTESMVCLLQVLCIVRGLCVVLITHPEESCRMLCVWVWSWNLYFECNLAHWGPVASWSKILSILFVTFWALCFVLVSCLTRNFNTNCSLKVCHPLCYVSITKLQFVSI